MSLTVQRLCTAALSGLQAEAPLLAGEYLLADESGPFGWAAVTAQLGPDVDSMAWSESLELVLTVRPARQARRS
jgi:hypothetical protein